MMAPRKLLICGVVVGLASLLLVSRCLPASSSAVPTSPANTANTSASPRVTSPTTPDPAAGSNGATGSRPSGDDRSHGDDGLVGTPPIMVQPTQQPDVRETAADFAAAWLNTYGQSAETWRATLVPRVTPDLAASLTTADPASVPAAGRVGNPIAVTAEGGLYNAAVPVVRAAGAAPGPAGTLRLTLIRGAGGRWVVSEIDWQDTT